MAIRPNKSKGEADAPKPDLKLAVQKPAERRALMGEYLVQAQIKQIEREKYLGEAKAVKNEIDELMEKAKQIARETVTGQLKLAVEENFSDDDEDDLDGRVMDRSNTFPKKKGAFTESLEKSLEDAADKEDDDSDSDDDQKDE